MRIPKATSIAIALIYLLILFNADRIHNHGPTLFPQNNCPSYVLSVTTKADGFALHPLIPQIHLSPVFVIFSTKDTIALICVVHTLPSRAPPSLV